MDKTNQKSLLQRQGITAQNFISGFFRSGFLRLLRQRLLNEQIFAYFSILVSFCLGIVTYVVLSSEAFISGESEWVLLLLGVDFIALIVLLFFVIRQILVLIKERRQKLAGYQLRWRLVILFGMITVFPAVILILFSFFILDFSLRGWFSDRISTAISESVTVAESYLEEHKQSVRGQVLAMANDVNREATTLLGNKRRFDDFLTNQAGVRNLSEAVVVNSSGDLIANSRFAYALTFSSLDDAFFETVRRGEVAITENNITNRLRAGVQLNQFVDAYLLVGRFIDPNVLGSVERTSLASSEYQSLDIRQLNLKIRYTFLFSMVALLLLLGAIWVGLNVANAIVGPLRSVIQVAEQVRSGNLHSRVESSRRRDEVAQLGSSFNNMLDQIHKNREELVEANRQLDKRREFTEAVLGGVSSGVIGIDENQVVTLPNTAALSMLGLSLQQVLGRKLIDIIPEFTSLLEAGALSSHRNKEQNVVLMRGDKSINLLARITTEKVAQRIIGYVVTFEDVSDLLDAQRKATWSDIARSMAHEIKNPLTPIQLAAERLKVKYMPESASQRETFTTYIETIIRQVDDIGRLVNEFSQFARMPAPILEQHDLSSIIHDQIALFRAGSKDVEFVCKGVETGVDKKSTLSDAPIILCDAGLIRQAFTNLLQNAVDSTTENDVEKPVVQIEVEKTEEAITVNISDNGTGFPPGDLNRLTEPYVTYRQKGTGLGLAIVAKIIEGHSAQLILSNGNHGGGLSGAHVKIIFPKFLLENINEGGVA